MRRRKHLVQRAADAGDRVEELQLSAQERQVIARHLLEHLRQQVRLSGASLFDCGNQ